MRTGFAQPAGGPAQGIVRNAGGAAREAIERLNGRGHAA